MELTTAATTFYRERLLPVWRKVKGRSGKSVVTKVPSDESALLKPHQQHSGIHRDPESRTATQSPVVNPNIPRSPSIYAGTSDLGPSPTVEMANLHIKEADGIERPVSGVPMNAPVAALRVRLAQEMGVPVSQLTKLRINGEKVEDSRPIWSCVASGAATTFTLEGGEPENLIPDVETLLKESDFRAILDETQSAFDQLEETVLQFCQEVMMGDMKPDDDSFTGLQDILVDAIGEVDKVELNDTDSARSYLMQLSSMLEAFEKYDFELYKPTTPAHEPSESYSLAPGQTIHIDNEKLRQNLGLEPRSTRNKVPASVSGPIPKAEPTKQPQPTNNLGFTPFPRLIIEEEKASKYSDSAYGGIRKKIKSASQRSVEMEGLENSSYAQQYIDQLKGVMHTFESQRTPVEPELVTEPKVEIRQFLPVQKVSPAQQTKLNDELWAVLDLFWTGQKWEEINWKKAAELVKDGADPSVSLDVKNCPNPLFLAAANYTENRLLLKNGDPKEAQRLNCLKEMLKHPKASEAMKMVDNDYGNTPLTRAIAIGDEKAAIIMVDYIDQKMIEGGSISKLLTQPNQKKGIDLAQNTPLMLALKTGCDQVAKQLIPAYSKDDLIGYKTTYGHDALDMICYRRFNDLMRLVKLYAPNERKNDLVNLYLMDEYNSSLEKDVYSRDMPLEGRDVGPADKMFRSPVDEEVKSSLESWVNQEE